MERYRLRLTIETRTDSETWQLRHDGGGESDRLLTLVKILEATALSIERGDITLEEPA